METTDLQKNRKPWPAILVVALTAIICLALAYASLFALIPIVILAVPGIFICVKYGWVWWLVFVLLTLLGAYYLLGWLGVCLLALILPPYMICSILIRKKSPAYESLVLSCAAVVLSIGLLLLAIYLIYGMDIHTFLMNQIKEMIAQNDQIAALMYGMAISPDIISGTADMGSALFGMSVEQMREVLQEPARMAVISNSIAVALPSMGVSLAVLGGMCNYLIPRGLAKRQGVAVAGIPKFCDFSLPRTAGIGFIVMFVVAMIPGLFGLTDLLIAANAISQLAGMVLSVQGLALVDFLIRPKLPQNGARVVILVLIAGLGTLLLDGMLQILGIFDLLFRFREKIRIIRKQGKI